MNIKEWPDNPKLYERCKLMNLFHVNLKYMLEKKNNNLTENQEWNYTA